MLTSIFFIIHRVKEVGTVVEYDVNLLLPWLSFVTQFWRCNLTANKRGRVLNATFLILQSLA